MVLITSPLKFLQNIYIPEIMGTFYLYIDHDSVFLAYIFGSHRVGLCIDVYNRV